MSQTTDHADPDHDHDTKLQEALEKFLSTPIEGEDQPEHHGRFA